MFGGWGDVLVAAGLAEMNPGRRPGSRNGSRASVRAVDTDTIVGAAADLLG